ncbi:SRPBCC family protein [Kribbella sp. CA-294648]|uniref:SRPBCC family protein n=1 Tax=Kribbella sp. CA-294648 TaxID=3239948 RepID=UPI003D8EC730
MPVIRNSVLIRCIPEEAFDYLSDHRAELEWNPKCELMEKVTDGPVGLGTKYRAKWKSSPLVDLETIAFDRPHSWTMHNGGPIEVTFTCRLEPVTGEGTRLHAEFEPKPHGWFRLIFPIFLLAARREEKTNMTHLRDALEQRTQPARPQED